jgi:hypothetical protein
MLEYVGNSQERKESLLVYKLSKSKTLVQRHRGAVEPWPFDFEETLRRLFAEKNVIGKIIFRLFISPEASQELLQT